MEKKRMLFAIAKEIAEAGCLISAGASVIGSIIYGDPLLWIILSIGMMNAYFNLKRLET